MNLLLVPTLLLFLNQPAAPGMHELTLHVSDVGDVLYGLSIPKDYDPHRPSPLVLARHPGGVPVAALNGDEPIDRLETIPAYAIHSRDAAAVLSAPAERIARPLEQMRHPVRFEALHDLGHGGRQEEQVAPFEVGGSVDAFKRTGRRMAERRNRQAL
jgi:hypothetical protein